ncbi:23711_t:CDS:2 [Gigaspora rosea]|nr:23711_t:CDS:2 [Gigaspora rosea]
MELENIDPLLQNISSTTISLVSQTIESTLQQPINLATLNSEFESVNNEFDEQSEDKFGEQLELYKGQRYKTVKEAYVIVELFAHSNGFGFEKNMLKKTQVVYMKFQDHSYIVMLGNRKVKANYIKLKKLVHAGLIVNGRSIFIGSKLTKEMLNNIEFYTLSGKINASACSISVSFRKVQSSDSSQ